MGKDYVPIHDKVWAFIESNANGQENAITADAIGEIFALDQRQVREVIRRLRLNGKPIASSISSPKGYYIPKTPEERMSYAAQLKARMRSMAIAFKSATANMPGEVEDLAEQLKFDLGIAS